MRPETATHGIEAGGDAAGSVSRSESSTPFPAKLAGRLWYWWSLFAAGALLLVFGSLALTVAWVARRRELVYPWARFGARNWLRLSGVRVRVRGREHLDPRQPCIFASNHRSFLDTASLFLHAGEDGRRVGVLAKKELLKVPILGHGMGHVNVMAIDRSNRQRAFETVRDATERIKGGVSFVVFAEGTRARPGELLPFKKGAFYMAVDAGVPVVPVAIKNTDVLMGKGTGTAWPGTMEIVFLPPVETMGLPADGPEKDEAVRRLAARAHAAVAQELARAEEPEP